MANASDTLEGWCWLDAGVCSADALTQTLAQAGFEASLLSWLRGQNPLAAARRLSDDCLAVASGTIELPERALWQLSAAFFEALSLGLLNVDMEVKRTASKLRIQMSAQAAGEPFMQSALGLELLSWCAKAREAPPEQAPLLTAVQDTYNRAHQEAEAAEALAAEEAALAVPARAGAAVVAFPGAMREEIKSIGDLRIPVSVYNRFLHDSDEWSRQLQQLITEWSSARDRRMPERCVSLAHALAVNAQEVGFKDMVLLCVRLENALTQTIYVGRNSVSEAQLYSKITEEIARLLHQFAAGFLKNAHRDLLQELADMHTNLLRAQPVMAKAPPVLAAAQVIPLKAAGAELTPPPPAAPVVQEPQPVYAQTVIDDPEPQQALVITATAAESVADPGLGPAQGWGPELMPEMRPQPAFAERRLQATAALDALQQVVSEASQQTAEQWLAPAPEVITHVNQLIEHMEPPLPDNMAAWLPSSNSAYTPEIAASLAAEMASRTAEVSEAPQIWATEPAQPQNFGPGLDESNSESNNLSDLNQQLGRLRDRLRKIEQRVQSRR